MPVQRKELDQLYRTTKAPRLRTRAQMVLLSAEQGLKVPQIAVIVRESEATVLRWLKRYRADGLSKGCRMHRAPDVLRRSPQYTEPSCWPRCADGPGVWGCRSRYGRYSAWSTTWRNKLAFGSRMRPSGVP